MKKMLVNVFVSDDFGSKSSMCQDQRKQRLSVLLVPFLSSFLKEKIDAVQDQCCAKYTKAKTKWQGQIFKEVACKTDANNVFSEIVNSLGGEFPSFFVKNNSHKQILSLNSVVLRVKLFDELNIFDKLSNIIMIKEQVSNKMFREPWQPPGLPRC